MNDEKQLELNISTRPVLRPANPVFPNSFARFPVFAPIADRTELNTKDWGSTTENVHTFEWGTLQRFGPGLNMYDEDTLIALLHLGQQHKHTGIGSGFPIPMDHAGSAVVTSGIVTPYEVSTFLKRGDGGRALRETYESIKRLSLTSLTLTTTDHQFASFSLFSLKAQDIQNPKGRMLIQFPPEVFKLLSSYIEFDIELRLSLSDLGKAIYKLLLLMPAGTYEIGFQELADQIGYTKRLTDLKNLCMGKKDRVGIFEQLSSAGVVGVAQVIGRGAKAKLLFSRI